jgi:hypothetical protein
MKKNRLFTLLSFILFTISGIAQIKGVVRDSITKEPIAYVNIFSDEKKEFNSESNGLFSIDVKQKSRLTFQVIGYYSKSVVAENNLEIYLKPKETEIEEVFVIGKKKSIEKEIDIYETSGFRYHNINHGCAILLKRDSLKTTCTFLSKIKFHTNSKNENSKIKFFILNCLKNNALGETKIFGDSILSVKKGSNGNVIDLSNIQIPEEGVFLCFEKLLIEENKYFYETTVKMSNGEKKVFKQMRYQPEISLVPSDQFLVLYRRSDKWEAAQKIMLDNPKSYENLLMRKYHNKYLTPSIKITLTN